MPGSYARTRRNASDQFIAITPNDSVFLQGLTRLYVGGAGNLVLKSANNSDVAVTIPVAVGAQIPFGAGYVMAATTATGIIGAN